MSTQHKYAVYLGNLRPDVRAKHHKRNLLHLFSALNVTVQRHEIEIVYPGQDEPAHAFVDLDNDREQQYVIQTLSDITPEDTEAFHKFEFEHLVIDGEDLRVAARNDKNLKKFGRHNKERTVREESVEKEDEVPKLTPRQIKAREFKKRQSGGNYRYAKERGVKSPREEDEGDGKEVKTCDLLQSVMPEKSYQEEWLERIQGGATPIVDHEPLDFSDLRRSRGSESDSGESLAGSEDRNGGMDCPELPPSRYYVKGQRVGNESRTLEFKMKTGKLSKKVVKALVGKYVVSFLNSAGGTLMLGVDDRGVACGREFTDKEEDLTRLLIDDVFRGIQPLVPPDMYSVTFVPVQVDGRFGSTKIVEISVHAGSGEHLYMTKSGDVFVRRDGSVQGPLKASDIQQWNQGRYEQRLRRNEDELTELRHERSQLRHQIDRQQQNEEELRKMLKAKRNSAVCRIL